MWELIYADMKDKEISPHKDEILKQLAIFPSIPLLNRKGYHATLDAVYFDEKSSITGKSEIWPHFPIVDTVSFTINMCHEVRMKTVPNIATCSLEELTSIFLWMCKKQQFKANITLMSTIYERISDEVCKHVDEKETIAQLLQQGVKDSNGAFLWAPLPNQGKGTKSSSSSTANQHILGEMIHPDMIVLEDFKLDITGTETALKFPNCPIKVISHIYSDDLVNKCFRREELRKHPRKEDICLICQTVEGSMVCRGLPLGQKVVNYPHLTCSCIDHQSLGLLFTENRSGLFKKTVGAKEMLSVLQTLSELAQNEVDDLPDESTESVLLPKKARELFKKIMQAFNRSIHRCATISEGLWPLSADDVEYIIQEWYSAISWPLYPQEWSVPQSQSPQHNRWLVIDDEANYKAFERTIRETCEEYQHRFSTLLIDFQSDDRLIVNRTMSKDGVNLLQFRDRVDTFLSQSIDYIRTRTSVFQTIPLSTVLFDMRESTVNLSQLINENIHIENLISDNPLSLAVYEKFMPQYYKLWLITLAYVKTKHVDIYYQDLLGKGDFRSFRDMEIVIVNSLSNRRILNLTPLLSSTTTTTNDSNDDSDDSDSVYRFTIDDNLPYKLEEIFVPNKGKQYKLLMNVSIDETNLEDLYLYICKLLQDKFFKKFTSEQLDLYKKFIDQTMFVSDLDEVRMTI